MRWPGTFVRTRTAAAGRCAILRDRAAGPKDDAPPSTEREGSRNLRHWRLAAVVVLLAATAGGALPAGASARLPPGVDAMAAASAHAPTSRLISPRLHTPKAKVLLLAFVIAGGATTRERVRSIAGDGLRWRPVARSDGAGGATEIWRARATHKLRGPIAATLAASAYPASIRIVAYGGASTHISAHAAVTGSASTPRIRLRPTAGSLVWTAGSSQGQRRASLVSSTSERRVIARVFASRRRTAGWLQLAEARTSHVLGASGASWSRRWQMASVDVVVPALKKLIEEGGRKRKASAGALPPGCAPLPAFEVGVQDDPVFLGLQPAMSPARGYELATSVFHARLLRLNVVWGELKRYGWAPYDRAVQMAREHCWAIHMTITWTPPFQEGEFNSELSTEHMNLALLGAFAREVAGRYAGRVGRFAVGNEPNGTKFMGHTGGESSAMAKYDSAYRVAYDGVKAADPSAQVVAGELAGRDIYAWLSNVSVLPNDGVGVHPYELTESLGNLVNFIQPVPLLVSEDGIRAGVPNQIAKDLELEEAVRRAGVKELVFYQLSRADANAWNTGIE